MGYDDQGDRLLRSVAEHLKLPLMQIGRMAEVGALPGEAMAMLPAIGLTAERAVRLIDGYLLGVRLRDQPTLALEPVTPGAILLDVVQELRPYARQYDCGLDVMLSGRQHMVMTDRAVLAAALSCLGQVFIEVMPAERAKKVVFAAYPRGNDALVVGVFGAGAAPLLGADGLRRARALYGSARQAFPTLSDGNGAGVFVADQLLSAVASPLRAVRHQSMAGLAARLLPSKQLQLV